MRKETKIGKRKKRKKALAKMAWYSEYSFHYYKAKKMYDSTFKQYYPYTTSNF
ncbi:hypothetical protein ACFYKX_25550 [Cytobacillus sp. FJAT-54145]|uniref:Uncharacterized protein n=1 Tax=Cytobacillus spartinae TaxID=3299023 RepID=A0ABW6KK44_9BACI